EHVGILLPAKLFFQGLAEGFCFGADTHFAAELLNRQVAAGSDPIALRYAPKNDLPGKPLLLCFDESFDSALIEPTRILPWTPNWNLMAPPKLAADAPVSNVVDPVIVGLAPPARVQTVPS